MSKFVSPFMHFTHVEGQKDFDQDYVNIKIKEVVKKTGEGEEDFVIVQKVIEEKTPIAEVVNRDAGQYGIKAIMERVAMTGDTSLIPDGMPSDGVVNDVSGAPEDLFEADKMAKAAIEAFNNLPESIRKGRSFGEFCDTVTSEELAVWTASLAAANKLEKKDGDE